MFPVLFVYAVFPFLIVPFACRDYYGVLVVVHYYRACYCEIAETLVHVFTLRIGLIRSSSVLM